MRSLINKKNASSVPILGLLILIALYIFPNIKGFGVGEMSWLPGLIILCTYSFLTFNEVIFYLIMILLCLCWLLYANFNPEEIRYFSITSSAVSYYILCIPILSSILLGRIIGFRFANISIYKCRKEIRIFLILISLAFLVSGLLNIYYPQLLQIFLYTGRTSYDRLPFFFTEPSQAASVILFIWLITLQFFFNTRFKTFFGKNRTIYSVFILSTACLTTYFSLPLSLIVQIALGFILILAFKYSIIFFKSLSFLKTKNITIFDLFSIHKYKVNHLVSFLIFAIILSLSLFYFNQSAKLSSLIESIKNIGFLNALIFAGGFRFYYSLASVASSFNSLILLPGSWYGKFSADLMYTISHYNLIVNSNILQILKDPIAIKPLGWLYFCIYDLGIIGFFVFCVVSLGRYLRYIFKGMLNNDFLSISFLSFQLPILLIPILPSTPSVFTPLLLLSALMTYDKNIENLNLTGNTRET